MIKLTTNSINCKSISDHRTASNCELDVAKATAVLHCTAGWLLADLTLFALTLRSQVEVYDNDVSCVMCLLPIKCIMYVVYALY